MTNTVIFKSVRSTQPALYAEHTFHMKRCVSYTYNYAPIDDYIVQNWGTKTMRQMADDLNEYLNRIIYRCEVLKRIGMIEPRYVQDGRTALRNERRELRVKLKKVEAKLSEINAA